MILLSKVRPLKNARFCAKSGGVIPPWCMGEGAINEGANVLISTWQEYPNFF